MKILRTTLLSAALVCIGVFASFAPQQVSAATSCDAYADAPYLDGIRQNVVMGGGWSCAGGYSSAVHIGVKLLSKPASGGDWTIIYTDSYWLYDTSNGSYYSSAPIDGCDRWYNFQIVVDGNLGSGSDSSSSYLSACYRASPASPTPGPTE